MKTILLLTTMLFPGFRIEYQQESVSKILDQYLAIKNALVNSDSKTAAGHAIMLTDLIENTTIDPEASNAAKNFNKRKDSMLAQTKAITATEDLEKQRSAFAELSELIWPLIKDADIGIRNVYYDYCPMKKSYWISEEVAIKNPYYGASMLNCGTVKAKKK